MQDEVDLLKIKIDRARMELPAESVHAIDAVDWRTSIFDLRAKKGYTFEQLGALELETELLLCGLTTIENYPQELEKRMGIPKAQVNELVNELNTSIFSRIRGELIKNIERNKESQVLKSAGIEIVPEKSEVPKTEKPIENREDLLKKIEAPEIAIKEGFHPILAQKLAGSVQSGVVKTEHTLNNITPSNTQNTVPPTPPKPKVDPYRMPIE